MRIIIDMQGAQTASRERGIGRYTLGLITAMLQHRGNHDIFLVMNGAFAESCIELRRYFSEWLTAKHFYVWYPSGAGYLTNSKNAWARACLEISYQHFIEKLNPDIVLITSLIEGWGNYAYLGLPSQDSKLLCAVILYDLIPLLSPDIYLSDKQYRLWYHSNINRLCEADLLLAISHASRQEALNTLAHPPKHIVTISADTSYHFRCASFTQAEKAALTERYGLSRDYILSVGVFEPRKNFERLLSAYAQLPTEHRNKSQLALIGKIPHHEQPRLNRLLKKLGLNKQDLVFMGYVPDHDLAGLYQLCKLFVFPSWHEGFGLPVLEAMRCGAPVIGANTSSIPEIIAWPEAMFDPRKVEEIAGKMQQALTDEVFRQALIHNGQVQAARFSWKNTAKLALQAMEQRVAESRVEQAATPIMTKPRLALVILLTMTGSENAQEIGHIAAALSHYYTVEVISDPKNASWDVSHEQRVIQGLDWFKTHAQYYDRIVYVLSNSLDTNQSLELLRDRPGVVLLQDINSEAGISSSALSSNQPEWGLAALYHSHGYTVANAYQCQAISAADISAFYPCLHAVLEYSFGTIVRSHQAKAFLKKWFPWQDSAIYLLPAASQHSNINTHHATQSPAMANVSRRADRSTQQALATNKTTLDDAPHYFATIEAAYKQENAHLQALIQAIPACKQQPKKNLRVLAAVLAKNFPARRQPQLLIDVSELVEIDTKSDIQREVHAILVEWLTQPPTGFRVEPVYATATQPYRYARQFTARLLNWPKTALSDEVIDYAAHDLFFLLDLSPSTNLAHKDFYRQLQQDGVRVVNMNYDLTPYQFPDFFEKRFVAHINEWMNVLAKTD